MNGQRMAVAPSSFQVVNPRQLSDVDDPEKGMDGREQLVFSQLFLRTAREAMGIPRWAGPFDFPATPSRFPPPLRRAFHQAMEDVFHPPMEDEVGFPFHMYGVGAKFLAALWSLYPSGLRQRLNDIHFRFRLDPRLDRAIAYLYRRERGPCSVTAMCREAGLSGRNAVRLFHQHFGLSPKAFLSRHRVEQAERLFRDTPSLDVHEAADQIGLSSAWALRKAYRVVRGTPAPW